MASPARYRSTAALRRTPGKTSWFGLATVICNVGLLTPCPESAGPADVIDGATNASDWVDRCRSPYVAVLSVSNLAINPPPAAVNPAPNSNGAR